MTQIRPLYTLVDSTHMCVCVCVSVYVFTFEVPFNDLFAPTSQSRMSNIFRDSESLGKVMKRSGLIFEHFSLEVV